jgi:hypothetical protein
MNTTPELLSDFPAWFDAEKVSDLEDLAAIGYSHAKMAMYFDVPAAVFTDEIDREESRIRYHIEKGILQGEADEAIATIRAAKDGNATQAQRIDKKRYQLNFQQLKEEIIYGKQ